LSFFHLFGVLHQQAIPCYRKSATCASLTYRLSCALLFVGKEHQQRKVKNLGKETYTDHHHILYLYPLLFADEEQLQKPRPN